MPCSKTSNFEGARAHTCEFGLADLSFDRAADDGRRRRDAIPGQSPELWGERRRAAVQTEKFPAILTSPTFSAAQHGWEKMGYLTGESCQSGDQGRHLRRDGSAHANILHIFPRITSHLRRGLCLRLGASISRRSVGQDLCSPQRDYILLMRCCRY